MSNPFSAPDEPQLEIASSTRIPPLSISHILIWMTLSAALISLSVANFSDNLPQAWLYMSVANGVQQAASITALLILFRAKAHPTI